MTRKKMMLIGGTAAVVLTGAAGAGAYYTLVEHGAPEQVTLNSAIASVSTATAGTSGLVAGTNNADTANLTGTWTLASDGTSFVGYRVKEELAGIGTFTAVGRTSNIQANLTFDGSAITDVNVTADLTGLTSDSTMRDGQLRRQGIQTDTYPSATFTLTEPVALATVPIEGETIAATATGNCTLHGVTRNVSIPLQGQLTNGRVVVVGSLDIAFADYGIEKPASARVLGMEDHGTMELQLVLQRGTAG